MFPTNKIVYWSQQYPLEDGPALEAGKNICKGNYSLPNLEVIVKWKSVRRAALIGQNSKAEISEALDLAFKATEPRSAFAVLEGLRGVRTPMASAILTAINQERYTIIDYRALEALGAPNSEANLNFYLDHYLPECKRLALQVGVSLRTLDRALWSWSAAQGPQT